MASIALPGGDSAMLKTWNPKVYKMMAFMAIIRGLGLLFYILLGFRNAKNIQRKLHYSTLVAAATIVSFQLPSPLLREIFQCNLNICSPISPNP